MIECDVHFFLKFVLGCFGNIYLKRSNVEWTRMTRIPGPNLNLENLMICRFVWSCLIYHPEHSTHVSGSQGAQIHLLWEAAGKRGGDVHLRAGQRLRTFSRLAVWLEVLRKWHVLAHFGSINSEVAEMSAGQHRSKTAKGHRCVQGGSFFWPKVS